LEYRTPYRAGGDRAIVSKGDADPDIHILIAAKAEYAKLK